MAYKKPQDPLTNNGFGIYPLTTADQVILSDGSRLEKNGQISIGGGTVKTVSRVAPDSAGNVALTASDVGALPSGGTAANSSKLGADATYAAGSTGGAGGSGIVCIRNSADDMLPVIFNGTQLTQLIYNGTTVEHLIYNGQQLY